MRGRSEIIEGLRTTLAEFELILPVFNREW